MPSLQLLLTLAFVFMAAGVHGIIGWVKHNALTSITLLDVISTAGQLALALIHFLEFLDWGWLQKNPSQVHNHPLRNVALWCSCSSTNEHHFRVLHKHQSTQICLKSSALGLRIVVMSNAPLIKLCQQKR